MAVRAACGGAAIVQIDEAAGPALAARRSGTDDDGAWWRLVAFGEQRREVASGGHGPQVPGEPLWSMSAVHFVCDPSSIVVIACEQFLDDACGSAQRARSG